MVRLVSAAAAIAASSSLAYGLTPNALTPLHRVERRDAPVMIGNDKPVFLGRMIVTATPLPPASSATD